MTIEIRIPQLVICLHSSFIRPLEFEFRHSFSVGFGAVLDHGSARAMLFGV
jgi:hypothetical protein